MFSALIRNRSIALSPDDAGATGAGGAAVAEPKTKDGEGGDAGDGGEEDGDEEKVDDKPAWKRRVEELVAGKKGDGEGDAGDGKPGAAAGKKPAATNDDDESKPFLFKVPGRKEGEADLELPLDRAKLKEMGITVKDARDRIGQLRNGYKRTAEIETGRAEIAEGRAELNEILTEMKERPNDFFLDNVTPENYAPLVTALIARMPDADFKKVVQRVAEYDADGSRRRTDGSDSRDAQHDRKGKREKERTAEQKRNDYVKDVTTKINAVIPDDWTDAQAEEVFEFATFKLQQHARKNGNKPIAPDEIPALLKSLGVLTHFELDEPETPRRSPPPTSRNAPPPKKAPVSKPRDTATDLQERRDTRRNASTTPGGAGAAAQSGPPKGQTFADRIKFVREKFGVKK